MKKARAMFLRTILFVGGVILIAAGSAQAVDKASSKASKDTQIILQDQAHKKTNQADKEEIILQDVTGKVEVIAQDKTTKAGIILQDQEHKITEEGIILQDQAHKAKEGVVRQDKTTK